MRRKEWFGIVILFFLLFLSGFACPISHGMVNYEVAAPREEEAEAEEERVPDTQANDIDMEIEYGFNKFVKRGRILPMRITITNKGEDVNGKIQVYLKEQENNTMYQKDVGLAGGETKTISFYLPTSYMQSSVVVQLVDEKNKQLALKNIRVSFPTTQENINFIGILSDDKDRMNYYTGAHTKVFFLDSVTLPEEAMGLDSLDILIINDIATGVLTTGQYEAVKEWVEKGGTLVLGTGTAGSKVWEVFKDSFITGTMGEVHSIETSFGLAEEDLTAFEEEEYQRLLSIETEAFKKELNDLNISVEMNEMPLQEIINQLDEEQKKKVTIPNENEIRLQVQKLNIETIKKDILDMKLENAIPIYTEDNYNIVQKIEKGAGNILVFSMELGVDTTSNKTIGSKIRTLILDHISDKNKVGIGNDIYQTYNYQYELINALTSIDAEDKPKVKYYAVVITIYIILIGPILYIFLKRKDKRNGLWIGIPTGALLFSVIVYIMGYSTRIKDPYLGYINFINLNTGQGSGSEDIYFGLTVPYSGTYKLEFDQTVEVENFMEYYDIYNTVQNKNNLNYQKSIQYTGDKTVLELKDMSSFGSTAFLAKTKYQGSGDYSYDIHYKDGKIAGSFTNNLGYDLTDTLVYSNHRLVYIGNVADKETIAISDANKTGIYYNEYSRQDSSFLDEIFGEYWTINSMESKKYIALGQMLSKTMLSSVEEGFVIGFREDEMSGILQELGIKGNGVQAVVAPISVDLSVENGELIPSIDRFITDINGDINNLLYRDIYSDQLEIEYSFGSDKMVSLSYRNEFNSELDSKYSMSWYGWYGTVHAYNFTTDMYDTIFENAAAGEITDLSPYLNSENRLRLKYVLNENQRSQKTICLPYISAVKSNP